MRIVQVLIPNGKREPVLALLDEEDIDYAIWEETGRRDFEAIAQFPVPPIGVEPVLDKLRKAGVSRDTYTIVYSPEMVVSTRIEALEKRYSGKRIAREELVARAQELAPATSTFFAFLIISTIIATGGMLLDSAANINVDYRPADLLFDNPPIVTVIMGYQAGRVIPPDIASRVDEHLTSATGKDVRARVGFVESQQTA